MTRRLAFLAASGLALLILAAAPLSAQNVTGRVVDAVTGDPVREARVEATPAVEAGEASAGSAVAATDRTGRFTLVLTPGRWDFAVEHVGYEPVQAGGLEVAVDEAVRLEIRLGPRPVAVEPLVVTARRSYAARARPFYERMAFYQGRGRFIDREEIERFAQAIPVAAWQPTRLDVAFRRCDRTAVFVDGVPVLAEFLSDHILRLEDLEGVELYRVPGSVPHELSIASVEPNPDCAVAFWTRPEFLAGEREVTPWGVVKGIVLYGALVLGLGLAFR